MVDENLRHRPPALHARNALFLDVDGTLVAFADHPEQVELLPRVRDILGRLSTRLDGAVALVSGRPLHQLDRLFAPLSLPAAGLHGHQLRSSADAQAAMPDATSPWLHALHQRAMQFAHAQPGILVEDKGAALALHWRTVPQHGAAVTTFAQAQLPHLPGYRLQAGDHVIEFVPDGSDKGSALSLFMQQAPFAGRQPVFVGDDLTDEFGFAAAQRQNGFGVLVGARTGSRARYALDDIDAVHAWLEANAP